jgi:hypothetical protein
MSGFHRHSHGCPLTNIYQVETGTHASVKHQRKKPETKTGKEEYAYGGNQKCPNWHRQPPQAHPFGSQVEYRGDIADTT